MPILMFNLFLNFGLFKSGQSIRGLSLDQANMQCRSKSDTREADKEKPAWPPGHRDEALRLCVMRL